MIINTNIGSLNAQRNLLGTNNAMQKSLEKLSSGYRINKAADDAAGLAISEKMKAQVRGLNQAQRNSQDGISLIQTAEGALNETHSILQRMRELMVQAGNGTNADTDLDAIKNEMDQLILEVDGIATRTQFNGKDLLKGDYATTGISIQIGANGSQTLEVEIGDMRSTAMGTDAGSTAGVDNATETADLAVSELDVKSFGTAATTFDKQLQAIDDAIEQVSSQRSALGAYQNRLEHTINNLGTASENLSAAQSRIRDVDMAKEMSEFTKSQVLSQAGIAMLAQANQAPQAVLKLLG